jgi:Domain of unknown function (DUF1937)
MSIDCLRQFRLIYLASPYSKYPDGIEAAFTEVADLAGQLIKEGIPVLSPIVHSHPICEYSGLDHLSHDLWMKMDEPLMDACDAICVAKMTGWARSKGVGIELFRFKVANKPAYLLDPELFTCEPF